MPSTCRNGQGSTALAGLYSQTVKNAFIFGNFE